jgi:hypothetical protein
MTVLQLSPSTAETPVHLGQNELYGPHLWLGTSGEAAHPELLLLEAGPKGYAPTELPADVLPLRHCLSQAVRALVTTEHRNPTWLHDYILPVQVPNLRRPARPPFSGSALRLRGLPELVNTYETRVKAVHRIGAVCFRALDMFARDVQNSLQTQVK